MWLLGFFSCEIWTCENLWGDPVRLTSYKPSVNKSINLNVSMFCFCPQSDEETDQKLPPPTPPPVSAATAAAAEAPSPPAQETAEAPTSSTTTTASTTQHHDEIANGYRLANVDWRWREWLELSPVRRASGVEEKLYVVESLERNDHWLVPYKYQVHDNEMPLPPFRSHLQEINNFLKFFFFDCIDCRQTSEVEKKVFS